MERTKKLLLILLQIFSCYCSIAAALTVPTSQLFHYADALNIEGGVIPSQHMQPHQVWANIAIVLDQPVITGETLDKITAKNPYKLKEASILDYNENKVNTAYSAILEYYIKNSRQLVKKPQNQAVKLVIYIHRNSSAPAQLTLFENILSPFIKQLELIKLPLTLEEKRHLALYYFKPQNTLVEFRRGIKDQALEQDTQTDVIVSFSLVAGLNPKHQSSDLLLPDTFIPYQVATSNVAKTKHYQVNNHLTQILSAVIKQHSPTMKNQLKNISSENKNKANKENYQLKKTDFIRATILEADAMFYPKKQKL